MTGIKAAPIYEPLIEDAQNPVPALPWILFFNQLFQGDTGSTWEPHFVSLTSSGVQPTVTGNFYQISKSLCFFSARVMNGSSGNTSSTSVLGTTYIDNFPLRFTQDGINFAVSGLIGSNAAQCELATNRIYVPAWSAVTIPLTIVGLVEAE